MRWVPSSDPSISSLTHRLVMSSFYEKFKTQIDEFNDRILNIKNKDDLLELRESVMDLSDECEDLRYSSTAYDFAIYQKELRKLNKELDSIEQKYSMSAFSFDFDVESKAVEPKPKIRQIVKKTEKQDESAIGFLKDDDIRTTDTKAPHFTDISHSKIIISKALMSVKISNIKLSLAAITSVDGSIYISHARDSVFIVNCHQFRMHNSKNCAVYISCKSKRPVIEECSNIQFGQFPHQIDSSIQTTSWETVDDFNWLKSEPSVNWKKVELFSEKINLDDSLDKLLEYLNQAG